MDIPPSKLVSNFIITIYIYAISQLNQFCFSRVKYNTTSTGLPHHLLPDSARQSTSLSSRGYPYPPSFNHTHNSMTVILP